MKRLRWIILALCVWALLPQAPGREILGPKAAPVWLIDHGYHTGLAMRREDLAGAPALAPILAQAPSAPWFEIGWGDENFYTRGVAAAEVTIGLAAKALLTPTPSVLHVVALPSAPNRAFQGAPMLRLDFDTAGAQILRDHIASSLTQPLEHAGPGLYGRSSFFRARQSYHIFYVCNHWLSEALNAAGAPSSMLYSTLPIGLFTEIRLRGAPAAE